jgi:drug/metabolite transporter (DMT)-like permease
VLFATVLALASAVLHAAWNLFVKTSVDRELASWGQFLAAGAMALPVVAVIGPPPVAALPYLAASAVIHVGYVHALVRAYHHGDFSLAYPIARGGGAVLAAIGGSVLLDDIVTAPAWGAIAIAGVGLVSLAGRSATAVSVGWAALTACTIAAYTLIDSSGVRASDDGMRYGFALMPCAAAALSVAGIARGRWPDFRASIDGQWRRYVLAGTLLTAAYTMVLIAVRRAPVGHVAMLRESSVVLAALAGWLVLHEPASRHRLVSSAVVVVGLVLLVKANLG